MSVPKEYRTIGKELAKRLRYRYGFRRDVNVAACVSREIAEAMAAHSALQVLFVNWRADEDGEGAKLIEHVRNTFNAICEEIGAGEEES